MLTDWLLIVAVLWLAVCLAYLLGVAVAWGLYALRLLQLPRLRRRSSHNLRM